MIESVGGRQRNLRLIGLATIPFVVHAATTNLRFPLKGAAEKGFPVRRSWQKQQREQFKWTLNAMCVASNVNFVALWLF